MFPPIQALRRHLPILVGVLASIGYALTFTWPLARNLTRGLPRGNTDPLFHTWAIHAFHRRWDRLDVFPLFETNNFFPHDNALVFSDTFLGQAVVSYPFHLLGADPSLTHNLCYLLIFTLVAAGAFFPTWKLTGSTTAGLTALAVMGFAQTRYSFLDHLNIQSGFLLIPALACWLRLMEGPSRRAAIGLGVSLGLQWWFSGQVTLLFSVAAALPVGVLTLARFRRDPAWLKDVGIAGALMVLLSLPIVFGHLEVIRALAIERTMEDNIAYAIPPREYLVSTHSSAWQRMFTNRNGVSIYLGVFAMVLSVLGVIVAAISKQRNALRHPAHAAALFGIAVIAVLCSFGPLMKPNGHTPMPYYYLLKAFPPLLSMRAPARFFVPLSAVMALLAAIPVATLAGRLGRLAPLAAVLPAFVVWDLWVPPFPTQGVPSRSPALEAFSKEHPGASINELPDGRPENFTATWRSIFHDLNTTHGTSGTTPPLTGALRCRANRFPLPDAVEPLRAMGVEFVAVHEGQRGFTRTIPNTLPLAFEDNRTRIFSIGKPEPRLLDSTSLRGHHFPLVLPSQVPANVPITAAIDLRALLDDGTRASSRPAVHVQVRLSNGETQKSIIRLPAILDAHATLAPFSFTASTAGPLTVQVLLDGTEIASAQTQVVESLTISQFASNVSGVEVELKGDVKPWLSGRCGTVGVTVRNRSNVYLQAYPTPLILPAEAGKIVLDLEFLLNNRTIKRDRAHQWQTRAALLWHDLAPGDETTVYAEVEAPDIEGDLVLQGRLGAVTRGHFAAARTPIHITRNFPPEPDAGKLTP